MKITPDTELRFLRAYKRAVSAFNILDLNMSLCLRWASLRAGKEAGIDRFLALPYDRKFKRVKSLIRKKGRELEYQEFIRLAEECRLWRNKLVHGEWELNVFGNKDVRFHVLAPEEERGEFTHAEFEALADMIENTHAEFSRLREKHPIEQ